MARLGLDDHFFIEVIGIAAALGDQDKAIGQAVRFFRFAQEKYKHGKSISCDEFKRQGFSEALIPTFAEIVGDEVVCIGAKKHFGWLAKKVEAGKKGGVQKSQAKTKTLKQNRSTSEALPKHKLANGSKTEASCSYSSSLSSTNSPSSIMAPTIAAPMTPAAVYISCYQEKYGHRPEFGKREGKILKTFSENHPDRWEELVRGYLQMPDSWAVARSHPVEVLVAKVNEIGRFLATGKVVTKKVIEHAEEIIDKAQGTLRKPRRSIEEMEAERAAMLAEAHGQKAIGGK